MLSDFITTVYTNTNEITDELSSENIITSHVKIACYLHKRKDLCCHGYIYTINPTLAQVVSKKSTRSALKLNGFLFH